MQHAGVRVNLFQHTLSHGTPDAVFPNNWFSTHPASETRGKSAMVLYPMKTKNRQVSRSVALSRGLDWVYRLAGVATLQA